MKDAINAALAVLKNEAAALAALEPVISSPPFRQALDILLETKGMVIVVGMGKSGLVAQKIAATFTSVGATSRYLHAGDALHGDLGAIRPDDTVMLISKSGQTREPLSLLPFLKEQKNRIIAITNDAASPLATGADVALLMGVAGEACPLNLAPMTSTTVTMAIGDALAAALIVANGVKPEEFARFHPGGKLGWLLTSRVADMIEAGANPTLDVEATLQLAVLSLVESRLGGVSIVDGAGRLAGVITDGDLKRIMLEKAADWQSLPVTAIMKEDPVTISLAATGAEALELMERRERQISVLPVVDPDGKPVGMLRIHDIIRRHL